MKNWIWHQKFYSDDAVYVGSYYNITHEPEENDSLFKSEPKFKSQLNGVFKRDVKPKKNKIGFK